MAPSKMNGTASPQNGGLSASPTASVKKAPTTDSRFFQAMWCCANGDVRGLDALLQSGLEVNSVDYDARSLLHIAAAEGQAEVVHFLVERGANIQLRDRSGVLAVHEAGIHGHKHIVEILKPTKSEDFQCSPWECENDRASLVLCHDILRAGSHVSQTVYGNHTMNASRRRDYQRFYDMLHRKNVRLVSIQDLVVSDCAVHGTDIDQFLMEQIVCNTLDTTITAAEVAEFKRGVIAGMTPEQMGHAATHILSFELKRGIDGLPTCASYTVTPLVGLLNERLQICTPKGFVVATHQDYPAKTRILEYVFRKMGLPLLLELPAPLKLSGGDYIPAGKDVCFIGVGLGTDEASIRLLLQHDCFGTRRVAVVRDIFDRDTKRRHLDSIMKVIDRDCIIALESILGKTNLKRRLVNEYTWDAKKGEYAMSRMSVELETYLGEEGYTIIKVPDSVYDKVGLGVYNFGCGDLVVNDQALADIITACPQFKGNVEVVSFQWSSSMYEWIYKATLVFRETTPEAHHVTPPEILERNTNGVARCWNTQKDSRIHQTTDTILMVAPVGFKTNAETAADNYFMHKHSLTPDEVEQRALREFSAAHLKLTEAGVKVVLFCNERWYGTPDAVFPNNWFSTHSVMESEDAESTVVFYPMKTESRRKERREYIISELQAVYDREINFGQWENSDFPHFLESTGVLVMDRKRRIAYVALSQRAYKKIAETWASRLGYRLVMFHATDVQGRPIYHTNVLMAVGTTVAVLCAECVEDPEERANLVDTLSQSHEIVYITRDQMNELCGNVLEVHGEPYSRRLMCMSTRAYKAFSEEQKATILKHVTEILHTDIDTIEEIGGGGIRCMMGELF